MIFIEETFSLKVVFEKDLCAKNLNYISAVIKSKTTNWLIIKNICIRNCMCIYTDGMPGESPC